MLVVNHGNRDGAILDISPRMISVNIKNYCSQFIKIPQKSQYAVEALCFSCH